MKLKIYAVAVTLLLVLAACGGGGHTNGGGSGSTGGSTKTAALIANWTGGGNAASIGTKKTADAKPFSFSLIETAYAQAPATPVLNQSFEAWCDTVPQGVEFVLYNAGKFDNPNCAQAFSNFALRGAGVTGRGTLKYLYCWGEQGSNANAGRVRVKIVHNGTTTETAYNCTPGTSPRALDARDISIEDQDEIVITGDTTQGSVSKLRVLLIKEGL
jgi:hypothetical protein